MREDSLSAGRAAMTHSGLFLLRAITGASMIAHHAWAMVFTGWHHFWHGDDWVLVEAAEKLGLPQPIVCAVVFSLVLFVGSLFLIGGLLGRVTPSVLLAACLAVLYLSISNGIQNFAEIGIMYSAVYVCLAATGPGALCLDRLFVRPQRPLRTNLQDIV